MRRLYVYAEGQAEQTFAGLVLGPHLGSLEIVLHTVLARHGGKKGGQRGGITNYPPLKKDLQNLLLEHKGRDVYFTTMFDLYALPTNFPGYGEAEALRHLPYQRVESLEQALAKDISDPRFIPYIQLHEFEACLFADPDCFRHAYEKADRQIAALRSIADAQDNPELINGGAETAPSKRIIAQFPGFSKRVDGPEIARRIGLDVIRSKCPHFDAWLKQLENLG